MNKIPSNVKIGWRDYAIEFGEERRNAKGEPISGEVDVINHNIYIDKNLSIEEKKLTLLHELQHAMFYGQGHLKWFENEELVSAISEGLFQLIIDNPKLFT